MCKTALPTLLAILISNVAMADVVRHDSVPDSYWGAWMTTGSDRFVIELSAKTYANDEANCAVTWVSETAGASGPIYAAHLQCSTRSGKAGGDFLSNLIIWPKSSGEIAVGHGFTRLKIFRRCRAPHPPTLGVARSPEASLHAAQTGSQGECREM
jgi:hypothetical protein